MQNEFEVMRVIRVPPMGALVVQTGEQRMTTISAAGDEKLRHRLLAAIGELVAFAGGYEALVDAGVAPTLSPPDRAPSEAGLDEEELTEAQARFLDELERELRGGAPLDNVLGASSTDAVRLRNAATEPHDAGGVNLVAEIDLILQKHVIANPSLAQRGIHLRQAPGQSLQIVVDNKVYSHPNEIEDDDVKEALKRALKEWEAR